MYSYNSAVWPQVAFTTKSFIKPMTDQTQQTQPKTQPPAQPGAQPKTVMSTQIVGRYKVEVINEKCIGAASCVAIAPNTFVMNEDNIAEVISQNGDLDDVKLLGAQSCPTAAVIVTDIETGKQVWPVED